MNNDRIEGAARKVEGTVQSAFGNVTGNASQEAKGNAKKVAGDAQNAFGKAEDCVRNSLESVQTHITDKPVQSTLIALGLGFVLGKLFRL